MLEVAGDELLISGPMTMTTSFNADLELESIEFVALAEKLQQHYGDARRFRRLDLEARSSIRSSQLTVGELVEFIASCRS